MATDSPNTVLRALLYSLAEQGPDASISHGDLDPASLRISAASDEMFEPLDYDILEQFCCGAEKAESGSLERILPSTLLDEPDELVEFPTGLRLADAFSYAHARLYYLSTFQCPWLSKIAEYHSQIARHVEFDRHMGKDRLLSNGSRDEFDRTIWQAFAYIRHKKGDGCIMGVRSPPQGRVPRGAILRAELLVLIAKMLTRRDNMPLPTLVLSFTDSQARVIQGSVVKSPRGLRLDVAILFSEDIISGPGGVIEQEVWKQMLCWGLFLSVSDIKELSIAERDSRAAAFDKSEAQKEQELRAASRTTVSTSFGSSSEEYSPTSSFEEQT